MFKIKSFFQSIQKPFQGPINSIKNVAVDVHHEIIQKPFQDLSIQKPFQGPINSIKNVAVDVHHEIIQKPFQGLSNQDLSIQSIQKPFQGLSNSIKNVAVVHVHHDQKHPSDLLMHPRRLQADVPAEVANQHVDAAYNVGYGNGSIEGVMFGSGLASFIGGIGWIDSATRVTEEAAFLTQYAVGRAADAAAAEASTIGIQATVIGYADAGAAAAALGAMPVMPAVAAGVAEAVAALTMSPVIPVVLSATLVVAGASLMVASIIHHINHLNDGMHHAVL